MESTFTGTTILIQVPGIHPVLVAVHIYEQPESSWTGQARALKLVMPQTVASSNIAH